MESATPEEKAKWLLDEMKGGCCRCPHDSVEAAKTCCDEIIKEIEPDELFQNYNERVTFWKDVKTHLQSI